MEGTNKHVGKIKLRKKQNKPNMLTNKFCWCNINYENLYKMRSIKNKFQINITQQH